MIITGFLGYKDSPKWHTLDLLFLFNSFSLENIIYLSALLSLISFIILYLDGFKLSSSSPVRYFQLFSFVLSILIFIIYIFKIYSLDVISHVNDKDNNINLHGHVSLDKEAAKEISSGLSTIGSNLGLGATIAGVSTAVAKGIAKSGLPPVQKAGIILGAGIVGGLSHSKITTINRNSILLEESIKENASSSSNITTGVNKLIDTNIESSPLQDLLLNLELTNYVCLTLILILAIQILFKFNMKDNIKINLSKVLGNDFNKTLEYYFNKIILLNKKMSIIYI
jgi:hypothetical protein